MDDDKTLRSDGVFVGGAWERKKKQRKKGTLCLFRIINQFTPNYSPCSADKPPCTAQKKMLSSTVIPNVSKSGLSWSNPTYRLLTDLSSSDLILVYDYISFSNWIIFFSTTKKSFWWIKEWNVWNLLQSCLDVSLMGLSPQGTGRLQGEHKTAYKNNTESKGSHSGSNDCNFSQSQSGWYDRATSSHPCLFLFNLYFQ